MTQWIASPSFSCFGLNTCISLTLKISLTSPLYQLISQYFPTAVESTCKPCCFAASGDIHISLSRILTNMPIISSRTVLRNILCIRYQWTHQKILFELTKFLFRGLGYLCHFNNSPWLHHQCQCTHNLSWAVLPLCEHCIVDYINRADLHNENVMTVLKIWNGFYDLIWTTWHFSGPCFSTKSFGLSWIRAPFLLKRNSDLTRTYGSLTKAVLNPFIWKQKLWLLFGIVRFLIKPPIVKTFHLWV